MTVSAQLKSIRTIQESKKAKTVAVCTLTSEKEYLVSNVNLEFRCATGMLRETEAGVELGAALASALQVKVGDAVRYVLLK